MNIAKMMQQAKALQDKMQTMQDHMANVSVHGVSGAGLVKITLTCKGQCQNVEIDQSLVRAEEKEILEDLVRAALNDAKNKADEKMADETKKMMSDLGIPAGMMGGGLPF